MSFPPNLGITTSFIIDSNSYLVLQELPSLSLPSLELPCSPFSKSKMNGYSRIKKISTSRSKSVDFGDLSFQNHTPRSKSNSQIKPKIQFQETKLKPNTIILPKSIPEDEHEDETGEVFGTILSREYPSFSTSSRKFIATQKMGSVSSTTYKTAMAKQQKSPSFHSVLKSTISFKRSASVSEAYTRIHHQSDLAGEGSDKPETESAAWQRTSTKRKGKFLKACRRLFGL